MDLEDQRQLDFETRMARLKERAAEVKNQLSDQDRQQDRVSSGMHEAIESLAKAIQDTARILT
jgi:hypothetical protein